MKNDYVTIFLEAKMKVKDIRMEIIIFENEKEVDEYVGQHIIHFIQSKKDAVIGFATGNTPLGTYQYLIDKYQHGYVDFSCVKAFNLDEYVGVEKMHPRSFATAMKESLFDFINIKTENIYSLNGAAKDLERECLQYDQLIQENPIDIQILGIGMDGHIAYNEPGSPFDGGSHVVDLQQESIESSLNYGFEKIEDVPKQGMTQGIHTIMQAKELIMMAKGTKKAKLVKRMIEGKVSEDFPGSIIQKHPHVIVVLDKEAAQDLKEYNCFLHQL